jgi:hypothetical protein
MWLKWYVEVKGKVVLPIERLNHKRVFFFRDSSAVSIKIIAEVAGRTPLDARQFEATHYNELGS